MLKLHAIISRVNSCDMIYVHVGFAFTSTATMRWNLNIALIWLENSFLCHNSDSFVNKKIRILNARTHLFTFVRYYEVYLFSQVFRLWALWSIHLILVNVGGRGASLSLFCTSQSSTASGYTQVMFYKLWWEYSRDWYLGAATFAKICNITLILPVV